MSRSRRAPSSSKKRAPQRRARGSRRSPRRRGGGRLLWGLGAIILAAAVVLVLVAQGVLGGSSPPTKSDIPRISIHEVKQKLDRGDDFVLVGTDPGPEEHFVDSHIPGAISIPLEEMGARYAELPRTKDIVLYCM